jgi:hypothetical protein
MKPINLWIGLFMLVNTSIFSQGIFKTANDFRSVNYLLKASSSQNFKVYPNRVFNSATIKVKLGDSTYSFLKSEIYGYQDNKHSYRFYKNEQYTIENPSENILIYSKIILAGPKGNIPTKVYFFSKDENSEIVSLTLQNLKTAFQTNVAFYDSIDLHFKDDSDLLKYDSLRKMYFINYLYQKSKNY